MTSASTAAAATAASAATNNVQTILLPELELTQSDVDDVCCAIVHSILFARVIGLYRPLEGHIQSLDISFPQLDDESIRSDVANAGTRFATRLQAHGRDMLCVKFFETRKTSNWLFQQKHEQVCWEQWYIPVRLASFGTPADAAAARARCARQVAHCLQQVVDVVNNPKHYIPPFASHDKVPFKFEIAPLKTDAAGTGLADLWAMIGNQVTMR